MNMRSVFLQGRGKCQPAPMPAHSGRPVALPTPHPGGLTLPKAKQLHTSQLLGLPVGLPQHLCSRIATPLHSGQQAPLGTPVQWAVGTSKQGYHPAAGISRHQRASSIPSGHCCSRATGPHTWWAPRQSPVGLHSQLKLSSPVLQELHLGLVHSAGSSPARGVQAAGPSGPTSPPDG